MSTVTGTFGESLLLTVEERKKLAEKWIQTGKDRLDQKDLVCNIFEHLLKFTNAIILLVQYQTGLQGNGDGAASHPGDTEYS